jgi:PAS domain S-box-containing protein
MTANPKFSQDAIRLNVLRQYEVLDSQPEKALDDLTAMAAEICETPFAVISIVDDRRSWFKAKFGVECTEVSNEFAFCARAIEHKDLLVIADATKDPRYASNPFVTGEKHLRFYAGAPLINPEGIALGALCVLDTKPHQMTEMQMRSLRVLAEQVTTHLELGRQVAALRMSQECFSSAFEHAAIGMALVSLDGHWTKVNKALCDLLGYTEEELCCKTVAEVTHADDIATNLTHARRLLDGGKSCYKIEKRYRHKSGAMVWALVNVSIIRDKRNRPQYFISQIEDIGDLKEAMKVQQELTQKAQAAERAKSQFLATMSHEIRTPLNGVIGMASILADMELTPTQRECVDTINVSGETLLAVINDILDYSKIEAGRLELEQRAFNLQQTVEEAFDIFATQLRSKRLDAFHLVSNEIPTSLCGDSTRLRQILVNLIGNAIKFTAKGEITVNVERTAHDAQGHHLLFSVTDSGIGIPPHAVTKLFNAFQQVDSSTTRQFGGTGLGLAICKRLTTMMGGRIWVESEQGKGSTFFFSIVLKDAPAAEIADSPSTSGLLKGRQALIVDDHPTNRRVLEMQLKFWGMEAIAATSGAEALNILATRKFDTILVDLLMPEMDGIELGRAIRRDHQVPLLLLSSTGETIAPHDSALFELQIPKPIKHSVLFNALLKLTGVQDQPQPKTLEKKLNSGLAERNPLRILLAEDNLVNQKVGMMMLSRMGYTANAVPNGKRALEALENAVYDIVLMDIQMPEMNGIDATRMILDTYGEKRPVVVALTAEALEGDEERFLSLGFDGYLSKPIQAHKLQKILESVVPLGACCPIGR